MKVYQDFPRKGVSFMDINSVLNDIEKLKEMRSNLLDSISYLKDNQIDKVVVIESRGFIFGTDIAMFLNAGLALARKPGKLPGNLLSQEYDTEYSRDKIELQIGSIMPGDRVLIHDDVLATGGTARCVKSLVEKLGGTVVAFSCIMAISALNGQDALNGTKCIAVKTV